jgi:hypothetical protein
MAPVDERHRGVERQLGEAILTGQLVDLREGDTSADAAARGSRRGARRTVPAVVLFDLLTRGEGPAQPRALRLAGARIAGRLDLEAAHLACPILLLDCWFEEPLALTEATVPALRLPGCHLPALDAEQLTTRGNVELRDGFHARGEVNLGGAHIGGSLILDGATLSNPDGRALYADRLTVDQAMLCQEGFSAQGAVYLEGAHVGGSLRLKGATLTNPGGYALFARRLTVDQNMACQGCSVHGEVDLDGARIGEGLVLDQASFTNPGGAALILAELRARTLILRDLVQPPDMVVLLGAQVGALVDDPASWSRTVDLSAFTYDSLFERSPVSARQRLDWLGRDPRGYSPQPYEQLAGVYRRAGRDQDARTVAIAKQRARRRTLPLPAKVWSLLLDGLIGYGYRTWQAGLWLLGFWLAGWLVFAGAYPASLTPAKPGEPQPAFQPLIYALDTLLPVVNLHQEDSWLPRGGAQWWAWSSILVGWVLTTAAAAAFTGVLKRD